MNRALLTATALIATVGAGCTGVVDKSGAQGDVTTLVLASQEGTRTKQVPAVSRFMELVDERSNGRLHVEPATRWFGEPEQDILEDVAAGDATLGWSGTRALDLVGVDAFQPLHAPYLIGSYEAQRAVVGDEVVAQEMLRSLDEAGLTGLALLADELRFPASTDDPLLGPAHFEDIPFGVAASQVQVAAVTALGARAVESPQEPKSAQAREMSWQSYLRFNTGRTTPFVTANAVLWPRTTVLVANPHVLEELSSEDRDIIEQAAAEASAWSVDHADDAVPSEIATACADGARIATASPRQLQALRDKVEPVYVALRERTEQAALLERIEQLVQGVGKPAPTVVPDDCDYRPGDEGPEVRVLPEPIDGPGRTGGLPAGTYRYTLTEDEINTGLVYEPEMAQGNAGVWTWTLADGRWAYEVQLASQHVPEGYAGTTCEGYYDVHGDQVDFTTVTRYESGECASTTWKATWRETQDGLAMDVTTDANDLDFLFGSKTWERID